MFILNVENRSSHAAKDNPCKAGKNQGTICVKGQT